MKTGDRESKKESLSLFRLVNMVDPQQYPDLRPIVQSIWGKIDNTCKPFRLHRHQRIAHIDLARVQSTIELLPGISRQMIEDILDSIRGLMNAICGYFDEKTQSFITMNPVGIDGEVLIHHLETLQEYYSTNAEEQ
jgi:hypothetical protein